MEKEIFSVDGRYKALVKRGKRSGLDTSERESIAECVLSEVDFDLYLQIPLVAIKPLRDNLWDIENSKFRCACKTARKKIKEFAKKYNVPINFEDDIKTIISLRRYLKMFELEKKVVGILLGSKTNLNIEINVFSVRVLFSRLDIKLVDLQL